MAQACILIIQNLSKFKQALIVRADQSTGVILSTAFVHLLQDAFSTLQNPAVKKRWPLVGHWVGLIVYVLSITTICHVLIGRARIGWVRYCVSSS